MHSDQLALVNSALETEQARCKQLEDTQIGLKTKIEEVTTQFTDQCKSLSSQLDEVEKKLILSEKQCSELEEALSFEKNTSSELESQKTLFEEQLTKLGSELATLKEELAGEIKQKCEEIKSAQVCEAATH